MLWLLLLRLIIRDCGVPLQVTDTALPSNMAKRQVILLDPLIGRGRTLIAAIKVSHLAVPGRELHGITG